MEPIVAIGNDGDTGVGTTVADPAIVTDSNQVAEGFATIGGTNHDVVAHVPLLDDPIREHDGFAAI